MRNIIMIKVMSNIEAEAEIEFMPAFNKECGIWRLDVLKDVIGELQCLYKKTHSEYFKRKTKKR